MNKNNKIKLSIKLLMLSIAVLFGFFAFFPSNYAMAQYVVPACNSATLNGTIVPNGASTTVWFEWGTTSSLGRTTPSQVFSTNSSYSQLITGLSGNTVYYYRAMASNANGTSTGQTVSFTTTCGGSTEQPTVHITANPNSVAYNGSSVLTWSSTNATSCNASNGTNGWAGSKGLSGTFSTGTLTSSTTYNITCTNSAGSANDSATVSVSGQIQTCQDTSAINYGGTLPCTYYQQLCQDYTAINYHGTLPCRYQNNYQTPSVSITADRTNVAYNESTIIRWYPINATSCYASGGSNGWSGTRNAYSDSFNTGPLSYTTTYTISCSNYNSGYYGGGSDVKSVTVTVGGQTQTNSLTAITTAATQVLNTSAQLNSLIINSGSTSANSWFEWGRTINLGNKTTVTAVGALPSVIHTDTLSGLSPGTTYYFRAVAENSLWRNIGNILTFTTSGQQIIINPPYKPPVTPTSVVLITSSVDRNQPIVPTIDNTRPHPGDEINYTINYQNVGTGAITGLTLRATLPLEVNYMFSNPANPTFAGNNTLIFNLGTLKANGQGVVTIRVRVRDNIASGTNLIFPATLSYIDPSGQPQSVSASVTAQIFSASTNENEKNTTFLGANVLGAGFFPGNLFGWLLLLILILVLVLLVRYIYTSTQSLPFRKKTTTTTVQH